MSYSGEIVCTQFGYERTRFGYIKMVARAGVKPATPA
jgi:hypothetical protein